MTAIGNQDKSLVITIAGDFIMQHRVSRDTSPSFTQLVELLRSSDLTMANLEGTIEDGSDWPAFIAGQGGFGSPYLAQPPWVVEELKSLGIDLVFTANNHSSDFGEGGVLSTLRYLDAGGILHAGSGRNLTEASSPTYVYTGGGRVAVIGAADNGVRSRGEVPFPVPRGCFASDEGPWFRDRPGINMLRYEPIFHVDREALDTLRRVSEGLGWDADKKVRLSGGGLHLPSVGASAMDRREDTDSLVHFGGAKFALGEEFRFETVPFAADLERNYKWIAEARREADFVVVGMHQQGASWDEGKLPDHARIFAYGAIDAGADVFVAHGRGRLGGVEMYRGKAILHGVPAIVQQLNQRTRVPREQLERMGLGVQNTPADLMDISDEAMNGPGLYPTQFGSTNPSSGHVTISVVFDRARCVHEVLFHPIERIGGHRHDGSPRLALPGSEIADDVFETVRSRMLELGGTIEVRDGTGVVRMTV